MWKIEKNLLDNTEPFNAVERFYRSFPWCRISHMKTFQVNLEMNTLLFTRGSENDINITNYPTIFATKRIIFIFVFYRSYSSFFITFNVYCISGHSRKNQTFSRSTANFATKNIFILMKQMNANFYENEHSIKLKTRKHEKFDQIFSHTFSQQ